MLKCGVRVRKNVLDKTNVVKDFRREGTPDGRYMLLGMLRNAYERTYYSRKLWLNFDGNSSDLVVHRSFTANVGLLGILDTMQGQDRKAGRQ